MFKLLDRYVLRECLSPFLLGVIVFTFMLLINVLFRLAEMIIQRDVPALMTLKMLALNLPNILVLTIPMALLFGVLIAIGRLSSDSELIAMRASGISLFALYRPVMLFSAVATLITAWLMIFALPKGNTMVEAAYTEVAAQSVNKQVQPGVFYDGIRDKTLFVFDVTDDGWDGVFFTDALPGREHEVLLARRGSVKVVGDGSRMQMDLQGTTRHLVDLDDPNDTYSITAEASTTAVLDDELLANRSRADDLDSRSHKSMTISELQQWKELPKRTERERYMADVEIHQKFAIPAACLVFGLFAVPLGFNNRRGGRSSGFALSIPIILIYRILQSNGEGAAVDGKLEPWLAMWLPNFAFLVAGLFLLWRKNRDRSMLFTAVDRWIRQKLWGRLRIRSRLRQRRQHRRREDKARRREQAAEARAARNPFSTGKHRILSDPEADESGPEVALNGERPIGLMLRLPRLRLSFPALIDRYLMSTFLRVFVIVVLSGITVYLIADLTDLLDHIMRNDIGWPVLREYFQVLTFRAFRDLSPVVVLLTVLIGFGVLSRTSEIIAAKAAGLSLYRLSVPAIAAAALVSAVNFFLEGSVLPYSNARVDELKAEIRGRAPTTRQYRRADRQWLFGQGNYIYHFQNYDPGAQRLQRLHVFHLDPEKFEVIDRMYAQQATHLGGNRWSVAGAWKKSFDGVRLTGSETADDGQVMLMPEAPEFFNMEVKSPEQMSPAELRAYYRSLVASGQDAHQLAVQLQNKVAMPAISLIMAFVALPFAFRLGKKGALYGIGLAIALGIVFYAIVAVFTTLGQAGSLPPIVAAWAPHVLFSSMSLYLFLGIET